MKWPQFGWVEYVGPQSPWRPLWWTGKTKYLFSHRPAVCADLIFYNVRVSPRGSSGDASMCGSHFRCDELCTVGHVSTLFLAPGSSTMRPEDNKFKNETNVWVRPSGAPLRDPDSEIPRLPRLFQDHCCSSFIFSTIKPCFFRQVQMGKLDGSSLGIKRSIIGGWSAGLFTLVALGVVRQVRRSVIF